MTGLFKNKKEVMKAIADDMALKTKDFFMEANIEPMFSVNIVDRQGDIAYSKCEKNLSTIDGRLEFISLVKNVVGAMNPELVCCFFVGDVMRLSLDKTTISVSVECSDSRYIKMYEVVFEESNDPTSKVINIIEVSAEYENVSVERQGIVFGNWFSNADELEVA